MNKSPQRLDIDAILICDSVQPLLVGTRQLMVHSIFEHACNLQTKDKQLITFQSLDMPIAPRGCLLPCDDLRVLFTQQQTINICNQHCLQFSDYQINLGAAQQVNLCLKYPIAMDKFDNLTKILVDFLPANAPSDGMYQILAGTSLMFPAVALTSIQAAVNDLGNWLQGKPVSDGDVTDYLLQMVGFGIGLTPSADDFLVGILFVLEATNSKLRSQLITALSPLLSRTTDISHAMLDNAIQGRYGAQLLALFNSSGDLASAVKQVAKYGHSSGHDMLCGIYFAVSAIFQCRQAPDNNVGLL